MHAKRSLVASALVLAVLSGLLALPATALPDDGDAGAVAHLLRTPARLARQLHLTQQQGATYRQLLETLRSTVQPLRMANRELGEQLRAALAQSNPDTCAIGQIVVDRRANYEAIEAAFLAFDDAFSAILTPQQLAKYERLKDAVPQRRDIDE